MVYIIDDDGRDQLRSTDIDTYMHRARIAGRKWKRTEEEKKSNAHESAF